MERKDAVLPCVMGSLALVCFLLAAVFLSAAVLPPWGRIPVLLLPALVLWGIGVLARKGMLSSRMTEALTAGLTILFLLLSLVYVFLLSLRIAATTITDTILAIAIALMCVGIIVKGRFPETEVSKNRNMRKMGIKCPNELEKEFSCKDRRSSVGTCTGTYNDACIGCGFYKYKE